MSPWMRVIGRSMFMIELILFSVPFVFPLPVRKKFPLRLSAGILICILPEIFWNDQWSKHIWAGVAQNILLFLVLFCAILLCFQCSGWMALYCVTGAYCFQRINLHIQSKTGTMKPIITGKPSLLLIGYILIVGALIAAGYMIFTRRIKRAGFQHMGSHVNLIICLVVMISMVAFNAIDTNYRGSTPAPINTMVRLYSFSCSVLTLMLLSSLFMLDKTREEKAILQQLWEKDKQQMALSKDTVDMINIKCHDMKHILKLMQLRGEQAGKKDLQMLEDLAEIYDFSADTGNNILNLVVAEKGLLCRKDSIRLSCMADGTCLSGMEDADIYSLFGNALDNAIRAARNLEKEEDRIIRVSVRPLAGMICIRVENYYTGELEFNDGIPGTTKGDNILHGYGTRSMRYIAEKYGGEMEIIADNGLFTVNFMLQAA